MMLYWNHIFVAVIVSGIVLCGVPVSTMAAGSIGGPIIIRFLSDITADGPRVMNVNPTHATLDFTSTLPVACAVIYGTDDTYGHIAVDPDMAGTAIIDHQPIMGNLEPNRT